MINRLLTRDDGYYYLKKINPITNKYYKQGKRYRDLKAIAHFIRNYNDIEQVILSYDNLINHKIISKLEETLYNKANFELRKR